MKTSRILIEASLVAILSGVGFAQSTWWVDRDATAPGNGSPGSPFASIHYAVHQPEVVSGDLVLVLPGRYEETVEIVDKFVTVRSTSGAELTVIDAKGTGTALTVLCTPDSLLRPGAVTVEGFTITGGTGTLRGGVPIGGGMLVENVQLHLQKSIVRANRATLGAGIAVQESFLDLYDVELEDNQAETARGLVDGKGGALYTLGSSFVQAEDVRMRRNAAGVGGGLFAEGSTFELINVQILGNLARGESFDGIPAQGGGLYAMDAVMEIHDSLFAENLAWGPDTRGGGLRVVGESQAFVERTRFEKNAAGDWRDGQWSDWMSFGGGVSSGVDLLAYDIELAGNHASRGGGFHGSGTLHDPLVSGNTAHLGGGLYTEPPAVEGQVGCYSSSLYIANGEISDNQALAVGGAHGEGGGIWGPAVAEGSTVVRNVAQGHGGGAYGANLIRTYVGHNRIVPGGAFGPHYGGGVYGGHVEASVLEENAASGFGDIPAYGGGAANAMLILTQVCGNLAPYAGGAANCLVDRCTVYGNEATHDCGGLYFGSSGHVTSSIVWKNKPQQIVDHFGVSVEYSTIQKGWPGLHNTEVNPMFWYQESCDFQLLPSSYAIDRGDPAGKDPDGSRCDQGAFPYDPDHCGIPEVYCEAKLGSQGCLPQIGFTGTPTLTGEDDFVITAVNLSDGESGLMVWGYNAGERPFQGSTLCITGPLIRTPVQGTGGSAAAADPRCSGALSFHLSHEYMDDHYLWHGRAIYAQFLYRDPGDPAGFGFTDALHLVICP